MRWLRKLLGDEGERIAAKFLRKQGLRILERQSRFRRGEIDLIARDGDCVVFVEVKTRRRGDPGEAVTPEKQQRITRAALTWLKRHKLLGEVATRFDVIAIVLPEDTNKPEIQHEPHAFRATGNESMWT